MRTIKFRAWDIKGKMMLTWEDMYGLTRAAGPEGVAVHVAAGDHCYLMPEQIHLMQFTGIFDKNGKEIWEGDVLEKGDTRYSVTWSKKRAGFWITGKPKGFSHYQTLAYDSQVARTEIIGNIYENPELLGGPQ